MIRIILSWTLYWAGDLVSRPMNWCHVCGYLYSPYCRLMCWSLDLQGDDRSGPWEPVQ
jgi:hypothetical protein